MKKNTARTLWADVKADIRKEILTQRRAYTKFASESSEARYVMGIAALSMLGFFLWFLYAVLGEK